MSDLANSFERNRKSTLWVLRNKRGRTLECVARHARAGVELEILADGTRVITRRLASGREAVVWAEDLRVLWSRS